MGEKMPEAPRKKYPLGGWLPPILNLQDPEYCEFGCPVCRPARRGSRLARWLQSIELGLTGGGCPWGRAREKKYGVPPDKPIPSPAASTAPGNSPRATPKAEERYRAES